MGSARALYERFKLLIHEAAKFGVVGIVGVFLNIAISNGMHYGAGVGKTAAALVGAVITTIISYIANRYWSFRHRERAGLAHETMWFVALNGVGIAIQAVTVALFDHGLGLSGKLAYNFALVLGILLGTVFRFWSYRKWVWAAPAEVPDGHEALEPALATVPDSSAVGDEAGTSP